jgi:hypothetical protein
MGDHGDKHIKVRYEIPMMPYDRAPLEKKHGIKFHANPHDEFDSSENTHISGPHNKVAQYIHKTEREVGTGYNDASIKRNYPNVFDKSHPSYGKVGNKSQVKYSAADELPPKQPKRSAESHAAHALSDKAWSATDHATKTGLKSDHKKAFDAHEKAIRAHSDIAAKGNSSTHIHHDQVAKEHNDQAEHHNAHADL